MERKNSKLFKYIPIFLCIIAIMWNFTNFGYIMATILKLRRIVNFFDLDFCADITAFYSWIFLIPALIISNKHNDSFIGKLSWLIAVLLNIYNIILAAIIIFRI